MGLTETIAAVSGIIDEFETMRGAYFFTPPGSAGGRRSYEKYHSHPLVEWDENGHHFTAEYNEWITVKRQDRI